MSMKKLMVLSLILVAAAALVLVGCPSANPGDGNGTGTGGSGADFDSSQYYTKTDIDHYLKNVAPFFVNANATLVSANSSYSTGAAMAGANTAFVTGATAAIVSVSYSHAAATGPEDVMLRLGVSDTDYQFFDLKDLHHNESRTILVTLSNGGTWSPTQVKWMVGSIAAGAEIDVNGYIPFYDPSTLKP
jgi:hypothetical protein